ncbi:MAG TPA: hypothetical protein DIS62_03065 [Candidatus Kerfeldbacteria bacterium]|nr:MAG: glycosyl transferase, group 1 [Parcubacteria group bacterium GW2011_GWC2_49_9]HCJ52485.1 hypothetical protein [Candidatus Kerfeldbacteria bacterium]HCM67956.1 hypothetical protein [Candidatus Kerfeldbacteria bacterium]
MKIGIDARFFGPLGKGLGRYTQKLIEHLEKIDAVNSYVIFLRKENFEAYSPSRPNFSKILADFRWYSLEEQIKFPRVLQNAHADFVHFPHFNVPIFYRGLFCVTIHDLILTHYPTLRATTLSPLRYGIKHHAYLHVIRRAIRKAKKIITVSEFTKHDISKSFSVSGEKIAVTYEGVEAPSQLEINANQHAQHGVSKPYILYVGNAYPHKNLERFIDAFGEIRREFPSLTFVVVGKDDYFILRLKEYVRHKGLATSVVFTGFVSDVDLFLLYQRARAFVFPSLYEGFGLPPLEAMINGTPVIASNATSIPEILGDAAQYFRPDNIHDMIQSIRAVHTNDNLRKQLIERGNRRVERFTWDAMARSTLDIYRHIV